MAVAAQVTQMQGVFVQAFTPGAWLIVHSLLMIKCLHTHVVMLVICSDASPMPLRCTHPFAVLYATDALIQYDANLKLSPFTQRPDAGYGPTKDKGYVSESAYRSFARSR